MATVYGSDNLHAGVCFMTLNKKLSIAFTSSFGLWLKQTLIYHDRFTKIYHRKISIKHIPLIYAQFLNTRKNITDVRFLYMVSPKFLTTFHLKVYTQEVL